MKYLALVLLLAGGPGWTLLTRVRDRNAAVLTGTAAYARGDAPRAATAFAAALEAKTRRTADPRLVLNLAHAQTRAGQPTAAHATYGRLLANTPTTLSSVARQQLAVQAAQAGNVAQALSLLRQALLLNPQNAGARFDFEMLSDYLAQRPNGPKIPPPPGKTEPGKQKPAEKKDGGENAKPAEKTGTDRPGETATSQPAPTTPPTAPRPQANAKGQPDARQPDTAPGSMVAGGRRPGAGTPQPVASGEAPGTQRGLDRNGSAEGGRPNSRPDTESATPDDVQMQTQRERLKAMNLSPAQARQLLETLRAQERQYLQQLTRPATHPPDPGKPTW